MNITVSRDNQTTRLALQGEIDELAAEELKKRFRDIVLAVPQRVEIDFAGVTHIGSAGIGKLLVFYKDLAIHGAVLALVRVPGAIAHLFREMKLDSIFSITEGR